MQGPWFYASASRPRGGGNQEYSMTWTDQAFVVPSSLEGLAQRVDPLDFSRSRSWVLVEVDEFHTQPTSFKTSRVVIPSGYLRMHSLFANRECRMDSWHSSLRMCTWC